MKLIVFGATGGTGLELLAQGRAAGHEMTAFSRRDFKTDARVIVGDVFDRAAVASAVAGHDVVLSALGTRPWHHVDICSGGVATILPAMRETGVRRIIAMSSLGVGEPKAGLVTRVFGATLLRRAFRDKLAMERLLEHCDRDWIAVRPGMLTSGRGRGACRAADDGTPPGGVLPRADTAAFMLQQLTADTWLRRKPVLVK